MAAERSDEPGVLSNLPRSRPGVRSDKRGGASSAAAAAGPAETSPSRRPKAAHPKTTARAKSAGASTKPKATAAGPRGKPKAARDTGAARPSEQAPKREAPVASERHDPVTEVVRLAGKVAETGLKTVGDILRRLPGR